MMGNQLIQKTFFLEKSYSSQKVIGPTVGMKIEDESVNNCLFVITVVENLGRSSQIPLR